MQWPWRRARLLDCQRTGCDYRRGFVRDFKMSRLGPFALAPQFMTRISQVRRGTWLGLAAALMLGLGLLIWAAVSMIGWFFGQAQALSGSLPGTAQVVIAQIEHAVPGAREKLGELVPALKSPPPPRDVSGKDVGPVNRYPGLWRTQWSHERGEIVVRYEGPADYALVLEHYGKGFAGKGYTQSILTAAPEGEKHKYIHGNDIVEFAIAQLPKGIIKVTLVLVAPTPADER